MDKYEKFKTITIDGKDYEFSYLAPTTALMLELKVKNVLPVVLKKIGHIETTELKNKISNDASFFELAAEIIEHLSEDSITKIIDTIFPVIKVKGENGVFRPLVDAEDFTGRPLLRLKVIFFALRYNFADFLAGLV